MSNNTESASGGIGLFGVLGVVFIVLKLVGVINWSWWLVTLPLWGGFAVIAVIMLLIGLYILIAEFCK